MGYIGLDLVCFFHDLHAEYLFAEVAFVEFAIEDHFVNVLQLAQRELLRQELETDRLILHLGSHALVRCDEDSLVVECEVGQVVNWEPGRIASISAGVHLMACEIYKCVICDRHDPLTRVAAEVAKRVELLKENILEPALLLQLPAGGGVDRFVDSHESAGKCPAAGERLQVTLDE